MPQRGIDDPKRPDFHQSTIFGSRSNGRPFTSSTSGDMIAANTKCGGRGSVTMKIALVATNVSSMGGVPQYVLRLGLALSGQHDVTIFSPDFEGSESPPIGHKRVWSPDGNGLIQRVSFSLASSVRMILAGHENDEFDIINAHGDYSAFANVTTSHYCEAESVKRLAGVQTSNTLNLHLGGKGKAILEGIEERLAAKRPLIVVSEGMKRVAGQLRCSGREDFCRSRWR